MPQDARPVCLIVGAGPDIGQALAIAFAREGCDIALAARNIDKLRAFQPALEKAGARVERYAVDAGSETSLHEMVREVGERSGTPDILVYNAATNHLKRPEELGIEELIEDFRVNVAGALVCVQAVAPAMKAVGRGTILLTGGGLADHPAADYASLSLGKAALRNLTFSLAQEHGGAGIHVATVTVHGIVQRGTHFDPERIAAAYVELHRQPAGHFQTEVVFK